MVYLLEYSKKRTVRKKYLKHLSANIKPLKYISMWIITKKNDGLLWMDFTVNEEEHCIIPIFTSADAAMVFCDDIEYKGGKLQLINIDTMDKISEIKDAIKESEASAIILDMPHPDTVTPDTELAYWLGDDFIDVLDTVLELGEDHDEKEIIKVINQYLFSKSIEASDPTEG
jgi:hypothetical protein